MCPIRLAIGTVSLHSPSTRARGHNKPIALRRRPWHTWCCSDNDTKEVQMEIRVRNVDEGTIAILRERSQREGRSLASMIRDLLTAEAMRPRREMLARVTAWHEELTKRHGRLPDSTAELRADRDERG